MAAVHPAVLQARRVVGLYGDPDVTWSVVLAIHLRDACSVRDVSAAAGALVRDHPHLGPEPGVEVFPSAAEDAVVAAFANQSYGDQGPLLRVAISDDGCHVVVAAHHGVVDGLGLLGAAARLVDVPLTSTARGIPRTSEPRGFLRGSFRRLTEALLRPPARVTGDGPGTSAADGDWLLARTVEASRPGSATLVRAAVDLVERANGDARPGRVIVSMGLSRRPGSPSPTPDRDTAYTRLAAGSVTSVADARRLMAATPPEPAFPVSDGAGLGPRAARILSHRLGATVLVSNLGMVEHPAVEAINFWPVATGPAGVCLGLASTSSSTVLTVRARKGWFSHASAERLADLAADCLVRAADEDPQ